MSLHHIRIPSLPSRFPTYALAVEIQSRLQGRLLEYKTASRDAVTATPTPPPPTLISFTPSPTYTLGRRQTRPLSAEEEQRLRNPLRVRHVDPETRTSRYRLFNPEVTRAPRGGLATYHGPGTKPTLPK
jgi:lipoyl(octanoyl) transferase 2